MTRPSRHTRRTLMAALAVLMVLLSACGDEGPTVEEVEATSEQESEETAGETTESQEASEAEETSGAQAAPSSAGPEPADSELITNVALCGDDTYDASNDTCPEMDGGFTTSALHCTADAQIEEAGPLAVRFYRNGSLAFVADTTVPEAAVGTTVPLFADINTAELTLPGGDWTCEMQLGEQTRETAQTTVDGPTERVSQGRACDNDETVSAQGVTHCDTDVAKVAADAAEVGCSAVLTDTLDTELEIKAQWDTQESGSGERVLGTLQPTSGILVGHGFMTSQALTGTPNFSPGDYTCIFSIDGEEVGVHEFESE
ncbi:MAG: hypothetical protein WBG57_02635 [Ornithinimicrobium sp.]